MLTQQSMHNWPTWHLVLQGGFPGPSQGRSCCLGCGEREQWWRGQRKQAQSRKPSWQCQWPEVSFWPMRPVLGIQSLALSKWRRELKRLSEKKPHTRRGWGSGGGLGPPGTTAEVPRPALEITGRRPTRDTTSMWNLKKWSRWTYLPNRNRLADMENKLMATKGIVGVGGGQGIN